MQLDLIDLRLFLQVAEAGSITHGARHAHLALAAASTRIRNLESILGVTLLSREPRGVNLTPAGHTLAHYARAVFQQIENLRGEFDERYALLVPRGTASARLPCCRRAGRLNENQERRLIQRIVRALQQSRMIPVGYLGLVARTLNDCLLLGGDTVEGDPGQADALINLWALGYEVITFERGGEEMPAELSNYRRRLVSTVTQFLPQPSVLQLSLAETLAEDTYSCCERTLTRGDLAPSCVDHIVATMASSFVIGQRIRQHKTFLTITSQAVAHLTRIENYA